MDKDLKSQARQLRLREVRLSDADKTRGLDELHRRLRSGLPARAPWWMAAGLGFAAAAALVFGLQPAAWYEPSAPSPCLLAGADDLSVSPTCPHAVELSVQEDHIELDPGTRLQRLESGLRLAHGRARFRIKPRGKRGKAFRLHVSAGVIVVHGTAFEVSQAEGSGSVRLDSGKVTFEWNDGTHAPLTPGDTLRWGHIEKETPPNVAPSVPDPAPQLTGRPGKAPPERSPAALSIDAVMRRQFQLRSQGRYEETLVLLRDAAAERRYTAGQRQRLSFELGRLLEQLGRQEEACSHWDQHLAQFRRGAHVAEVKAKRRACDP